MTILIGRFIGLVRAIAPFIAGASRMELRKFLPYDVLGAGLWSTLFCLLGYFFWQSLDKVEAYIGRGAAAFSGLVAVGVVVWFILKLRRDEAFRAKVQSQLDGNPMYRRARKPLFFVADHATFGLELTTLLALAAVGSYVFFGLAALLGPRIPPRRSTTWRSMSSAGSTPTPPATSSGSSPTPARIRSPGCS